MERLAIRRTAGVVGVVVLLLAIGGIGAVSAQEDPPQEPVCPAAPEGAIVVDLTASPKLLSWASVTLATGVKVSVDVPAGIYDIRLTSWDIHVDEDGSVQETQPAEQFFVRGYVGGSQVWQSGAISDLPDMENLLTETVGVGVSVPTLDVVEPFHAAYPDRSSPNSIQPVCIAFVPVAESTTTTAPATTTTTESTTTTEPPPTTTTEPEETSTTAEVQGTTITASDTTPTEEVEVLGTDVLPLTGSDSDLLALAALALAALGGLVLVAARRVGE